MDGVQIHLSSIFEVRWVASEKKAVDKLILYYPQIIQHLQHVTQSDKFKAPTKDKAKGLLRTLNDKNFYMILHFLADILTTLEETSVAFQKRYGLLIQQAETLQDLIKNLQVRAAKPGSYVLEALSKTKCGENKCETLEKYESANIVHFADLARYEYGLQTVRHSVYPKLTDVQFIMVSSLIENVKKYFPEGRLDMYKVLDPKTWPSPYQTDFGLRDIHDLYDLLKPPGATKQEVVTQWHRMVKAILADDKFCKYKKDLLSFWKHYLESPLVPNAMSAIVVKILSVPVGSADAERAFSTFFHIRDKRRTGLTTEHLEAYMNIRLNGPKDLAAFSALKYAKSWFAKGKLLTDSIVQSRKNPEEKIDLQNQKEQPKNAQGLPVGVEDDVYMDGSKYF